MGSAGIGDCITANVLKQIVLGSLSLDGFWPSGLSLEIKLVIDLV